MPKYLKSLPVKPQVICMPRICQGLKKTDPSVVFTASVET
jgi:hypothetical protein